MTKARIKTTGRTVDVISRFMPKKRNAPSRDWVCNLSDGTCINESEIEYLNDPIQNDPIQEKLNKKALEYANKHYSEWEEHWYDYNGYNTEPENDKLELIDAFIAGAEWQYQKDRGEFAKIKAKTWCEGFDAHKEQMLKDAVEGRVFMSFAPGHNQMVMADVDLPTNTKVRIVVLKEEEE